MIGVSRFFASTAVFDAEGYFVQKRNQLPTAQNCAAPRVLCDLFSEQITATRENRSQCVGIYDVIHSANFTNPKRRCEEEESRKSCDSNTKNTCGNGCRKGIKILANAYNSAQGDIQITC